MVQAFDKKLLEEIPCQRGFSFPCYGVYYEMDIGQTLLVAHFKGVMGVEIVGNFIPGNRVFMKFICHGKTF